MSSEVIQTGLCVCVCVIEREREREGGGESMGKRCRDKSSTWPWAALFAFIKRIGGGGGRAVLAAFTGGLCSICLGLQQQRRSWEYVWLSQTEILVQTFLWKCLGSNDGRLSHTVKLSVTWKCWILSLHRLTSLPIFTPLQTFSVMRYVTLFKKKQKTCRVSGIQTQATFVLMLLRASDKHKWTKPQ